ncbi:MAG: AI-2E family transporter [Candidatus Eiseniibacteriota bacterium]
MTAQANIRRGHRAARVATVGLFVLAFFYTLYVARDLVMPVVLALMLALVLSPIIRTLGRVRVPKALAALMVVLLVCGSVGAIGYTIYTPVVGWFKGAPYNFYIIESKLGVLKKSVEDVKKATAEAERMAQVTKDENKQKVVVDDDHSWLELFLLQARYLALQGALVLLLLFYLLAAGHLFTEKLVVVLRKPAHRKQALAIVEQTQRDISGYLFTVTTINIGLGVAVMIAMYLLGMPDPLLWGVVAAVLNFVPYLGPMTTLGVIMIVALTSFPTPGQALVVGAAYMVLVGLESEFVKPILLGRRFTLNPVVIVLSLVFWGFLWGVPGILLAIPILVAFKILCDNVPALAAIGAFLDSRPEEERAA